MGPLRDLVRTRAARAGERGSECTDRANTVDPPRTSLADHDICRPLRTRSPVCAAQVLRARGRDIG